MKTWRTGMEAFKHWGSLAGLALLAAPLVWVGCLLLSLSRLREMEWVKGGTPETREIIESSLMGYSLGVLTGMAGLMVVGFFADALAYRPRWLQRSLLVLGVLWLAYVPAGSMLGLAIVIWTLVNRRHYQAYAQSEPGQAAATEETKPQSA